MANHPVSEEAKLFKRNEWLNVASDIQEENAQREAVLCTCFRGYVSTIVGCWDCWIEHSMEYGKDLI